MLHQCDPELVDSSHGKTLNDQPFLHVVVWACYYLLLKSFHHASRMDFPKGISLAHRKVLGQECIEGGIPSSEVCFVGVEPRLRFAEQREWEQSKTGIIHRSATGVDGTAHFQKVL